MINKLRKSLLIKYLSVFISINLLIEIIIPLKILALTSGPVQPEMLSFEPVDADEIVDPFTGDFTYNIPLMDVGGYPINLHYESGITMDQEASWVGLGWNINPGVINRNMRGIPDDFNGDQIKKEFNIKDNQSWGVSASINFEILGKKVLRKLELGRGVSYNNYKGYSIETIVAPELSLSKANKPRLAMDLGLKFSDDGIGVNPNLSYSEQIQNKNNAGNISGFIGLNYQSRCGLQGLSYGYAYQGAMKKNNKQSYNRVRTSRQTYLSFATPTYVPQIDYPLKNLSASLSFAIGTEFTGLHGGLKFRGYYSNQQLDKNSENYPAFGYIYSQNAEGKALAMYDFNREKDGAFSENTPNLPVTNFTYDLYSATGHGIGGQFRPYRSDFGILDDPEIENRGNSFSLSAPEIGGGNVLHTGVDLSYSNCKSKSGKWVDDNQVRTVLEFIDASEQGAIDYESCFFKMVGEATIDPEPNLFNNIGDFDPVCIDLDGNTNLVPALNQYAKYPITAIKENLNINKSYRTKRQIRNQLFYPINAADDIACITQKIPIYNANQFYFNNSTKSAYKSNEYPRVDGYRSGHHITEIDIYRPDGQRYIYGIAAYNNKQEELSFAINGGNPDLTNNLVDYDHNNDNTTGNSKGLDHFYNKTEIPPYAHSYLLTAILTPDYVDKDNIPGPSEGDLGNYTRINYSRIHTNFKWRTPYSRAFYNEGLKTLSNTDTKEGDDKAHYIYGEKEIWYVHSIETRTHVAEFILEDRLDGLGTMSEAGGKGSQQLKRIKQIKLYSIADKKREALNDKFKAIPLKTVHFEYNYELCKQTPNSNANGKLTLKKIFFTYGNAKKGKFSAYKFEYGECRDLGEIINPDYKMGYSDRWGNYAEPYPGLTSAEFPYVNQSIINGKSVADKYACAWNLSKVVLPSGGEITIDYEADDYAYVQDKRAMQMFKIYGFTDKIGGSISSACYNDNNGKNLFAVVNLNDYSNKNYTVNDFIFDEKYGFISDLYFKIFININKKNKNNFEFVPGYAQINPARCIIKNNMLYIQLKEVSTKLGFGTQVKVHPVSFAAWNFAKLHLPRIVYNQPDISDPAIVQMLRSMYSVFTQIKHLVAGFYTVLQASGYGNNFDPSKSWIRLYKPDRIKKGGGERVKKICMRDKWSTILNDDDYTEGVYGKKYQYQIEIPNPNSTSEPKYISSGVALYEPFIGNEENPFKTPKAFKVENKLVSASEYFMETPMGESFAPAAQVGYSWVGITSLSPADVMNPPRPITTHAVGKKVYEFYTSRDFPVIFNETPMLSFRKKPQLILRLLNIKSQDFMTASQGYSIILNDMHGKPKAIWDYPSEDTKPLKGIQYKYKTSAPGKLDNNVLTMNKNGTISVNQVGIDYDFITDMRQSEFKNSAYGMEMNFDAFVVIIPLAMATIFPSFHRDETRFRSAVVTKVINQYGILDEVINYDQGAQFSVKNKLYDAETGSVLLTESNNNFKDPIFSFNYPAYWAYNQMGPAYKYIGLYVAQNLNNYLIPGDEIIYTNSNGIKTKGWVAIGSTGNKFVMQSNGMADYPSACYIIRPGCRNMQNFSAGNITTIVNPLRDIDNDNNYDQLIFEGVLDASAQEYTQKSGVYCRCNLGRGSLYNPYIYGVLGSWRPFKQYFYLTDRIQSIKNNNTNIRTDGIYSSFNPFWNLVSPGQDWQANTQNWTYTSEVTFYSPYGYELENKDALNRYSTAVYGYNYTLPVIVGKNAQTYQLGFENFEEYGFNDTYNPENCNENHFGFKEVIVNSNPPQGVSLSYKKPHSGRTCVKVEKNNTLQLKKLIWPCKNF